MVFVNLINLLLLLISTFSTAARSAAVIAPHRTFSLANITVTKVVTTTASQATTTTKLALLTCTTLAAPLAIAPCRREKQLWGFPVFYTVVHEDIDQFHSVNPTHVFKAETSILASPEETLNSGDESRAGSFIPIVVWADVESSFDDGSPIESTIRFADPNLFSAFFSSLLSVLRFPTVVSVTRTETVYTSTSTATLFTSTSTYTLSSAPCLPADFLSCPSEIEETPLSITDDPATEDPSTDVI